jgi:hypothetical protein
MKPWLYNAVCVLLCLAMFALSATLSRTIFNLFLKGVM